MIKRFFAEVYRILAQTAGVNRYRCIYKIKELPIEVYLSLPKRGGAKRYRRLYEVIGKDKCKKIMEIGTWNGNNATKMVEAARTNYPPHEIEYYGFDLFELMSIPKLEEEYAGDKTPFVFLCQE